MNTDALYILIPLVLVCLAFFATDAGKTIIVAFSTAIPGGGMIALAVVGLGFIVGISAYIVLIVGLLVWAMGIMGGMGSGGSNSGNSNSNNWRNTGGE